MTNYEIRNLTFKIEPETVYNVSEKPKIKSSFLEKLIVLQKDLECFKFTDLKNIKGRIYLKFNENNITYKYKLAESNKQEGVTEGSIDIDKGKDENINYNKIIKSILLKEKILKKDKDGDKDGIEIEREFYKDFFRDYMKNCYSSSDINANEYIKNVFSGYDLKSSKQKIEMMIKEKLRLKDSDIDLLSGFGQAHGVAGEHLFEDINVVQNEQEQNITPLTYKKYEQSFLKDGENIFKQKYTSTVYGVTTDDEIIFQEENGDIIKKDAGKACKVISADENGFAKVQIGNEEYTCKPLFQTYVTTTVKKNIDNYRNSKVELDGGINIYANFLKLKDNIKLPTFVNTSKTAEPYKVANKSIVEHNKVEEFSPAKDLLVEVEKILNNELLTNKLLANELKKLKEIDDSKKAENTFLFVAEIISIYKDKAFSNKCKEKLEEILKITNTEKNWANVNDVLKITNIKNTLKEYLKDKEGTLLDQLKKLDFKDLNTMQEGLVEFYDKYKNNKEFKNGDGVLLINKLAVINDIYKLKKHLEKEKRFFNDRGDQSFDKNINKEIEKLNKLDIDNLKTSEDGVNKCQEAIKSHANEISYKYRSIFRINTFINSLRKKFPKIAKFFNVEKKYTGIERELPEIFDVEAVEVPPVKPVRPSPPAATPDETVAKLNIKTELDKEKFYKLMIKNKNDIENNPSMRGYKIEINSGKEAAYTVYKNQKKLGKIEYSENEVKFKLTEESIDDNIFMQIIADKIISKIQNEFNEFKDGTVIISNCNLSIAKKVQKILKGYNITSQIDKAILEPKKPAPSGSSPKPTL